MRLSSLVYTFFAKKRKFLLRRCRTRAQRSAAAELLRQGDFSRLRLFGFELNAAFFKKSRAAERNVHSVRIAPQRPCGKKRAPLSGRARSKPALFSVVYRNMATIKKMINASIITAKITPHTTDRRNIVLFSPSEPG